MIKEILVTKYTELDTKLVVSVYFYLATKQFDMWVSYPYGGTAYRKTLNYNDLGPESRSAAKLIPTRYF